MIAPSSRLLHWTAATVLPLAFLAAALPNQGVTCVVLLLAFGVVALVDALRATAGAADISVELPPIVRMSKNRPTNIEVRIHNKAAEKRTLRIALGLPPEIAPATEEMDILLPADVLSSRFVTTCTPIKRGRYRINAVYVATPSQFGFWTKRSTLPVQCEI